VFLTAGDTMISTTHVDLRLRAEDRGIETRLIHGVTAQSAASGLTGLQNYRFGKAVTLPFPYVHGGDPVPKSVVDSLEANRDLGLHTLVYLDIKVDWEGRRGVEVDGDQYMTADYAAELFAEHWDADALGVAVCRAGSPDPVVRRELLDENKWRATRYGRDTDFIAPDSEGVVSLVSFVETESDRLGVDGLRSLLDAESGTAVQRRIHEESGLDGLCEHLTLD
jgi:hypothetical protein